MFVHLHVHSCYSFLDGLPSPQALAQEASRLGMPALALTDLQSLTGAIEFWDACKAAGVQPLLGMQLRVAAPATLRDLPGPEPSGHLGLLAMDRDGWGNLCRLSSAVAGAEDSAEFKTFAAHTNGLICLTGGLQGLVTRLVLSGQRDSAALLLQELAGLFPNRLYVEIQRHTPEDKAGMAALARAARQSRLPLVATHSIHYLKPEDAQLQRTAAAIRLIRPLQDLPAEAAAPHEACFLGPAAAAARFSGYPGAVAATLEIARRCQLELPLGAPQFPAVSLPPGKTTGEVLRQKAFDGARRLYGPLPEEIENRLEHELETIARCGYAPLFLIMEEILAYARRNGVPTASRGSAASSLVARCLGITDPDPMRLDLYFERFLNPARAIPPDIDTDLCSRRREEVIRFVYQRFGEQRVATVCTINRFRRRSALREVAKAYGLPAVQISRMTEKLPWRWYGPSGDAGAEPPYAALAESYHSPLHQEIFRDAAALIGQPHHLSVHPGGIVISPGPMEDLTPTKMAAKGVRITQFDLDSIERLGLVKIDLLGIRGLTVLGDVAERIAAQPEELPFAVPRVTGSALDVLDAIPEDDPLTRQALRSGATIGCFQIESPGMRATLRSIQAQSVDDLMVALALYRPGPLTGGLHDAFVRRHRGEEPAEYFHPSLIPLLKDTYGVVLYQEQVLRIAHELAGLSLADADLLRRAMAHFDPGKEMETLKEKFIAGAFAHRGVPEAAAARIWELMAAFAGYGFPKAHAASYARVGYRAAWCKTHYPEVFMAAVLANWGGYYGQRVYLTEARRLGLSLHGPHVNYGGREFSVEYPEGKPVLFMGLDQVKDLTRATQQRILHQRPFTSLDDFLARVDPRQTEAENLALTGALEGFGPAPALLQRIRRGGWRSGQLPLFSSLDEAPQEDWSLAEKAAAQEAVLGVSVLAHPLEAVADQIQAAGAMSTVDAFEHAGETVRVAGTRQTWRRSRTRQGAPVYFMTLEDPEGMLTVVIPSEVYRRSRTALESAGPYLIEGTAAIDAENQELLLHAQRIEKLE